MPDEKQGTSKTKKENLTQQNTSKQNKEENQITQILNDNTSLIDNKTQVTDHNKSDVTSNATYVFNQNVPSQATEATDFDESVQVTQIIHSQEADSLAEITMLSGALSSDISKDSNIDEYPSTQKLTVNSRFAPQPGDIIDEKYKILNELGRGGLGIVYKVEHIKLPNRKQFALKVLQNHLAQKQNFRERFLREIMVAMEFTHEHAVQIREFGESNNCQYFTMDFSPGVPLSQIIKEEKILSTDRALRIAKQILLAVAYAHKKNIIHRDLKPQNILIENRDGQDHALVLDFGLAKVIEENNQNNLTGESPIGTPYYMSPEQAENKSNIDHRTDLYSTGIILYEMLTGTVPFKGIYWEILSGHVTKEPDNPLTINKNLNPSIAKLALRALEKLPNNRYRDAEHFVYHIDRFVMPKEINITSEEKKPRVQQDWKRFFLVGASIFAAIVLSVIFKLYLDERTLGDNLKKTFYQDLQDKNFQNAQDKINKAQKLWFVSSPIDIWKKELQTKQNEWDEEIANRKLLEKWQNLVDEAHEHIQKDDFLTAKVKYFQAAEVKPDLLKEEIKYLTVIMEIESHILKQEWKEAFEKWTQVQAFYQKKNMHIPYIQTAQKLISEEQVKIKRKIELKKIFEKIKKQVALKNWLKIPILLEEYKRIAKTESEKKLLKNIQKIFPPVEMTVLAKKSQNSPWKKTQDVLFSESVYQLRIDVKTKLYLYGFQKDSTGNIQKIFPNNEISLFSFKNPVIQGELFIPSPSSGFMLDNNKGEENFYLIYSNDEVPNPEEYLKQFLQGKQTTVLIIGPFDHK